MRKRLGWIVKMTAIKFNELLSEGFLFILNLKKDTSWQQNGTIVIQTFETWCESQINSRTQTFDKVSFICSWWCPKRLWLMLAVFFFYLTCFFQIFMNTLNFSSVSEKLFTQALIPPRDEAPATGFICYWVFVHSRTCNFYWRTITYHLIYICDINVHIHFECLSISILSTKNVQSLEQQNFLKHKHRKKWKETLEKN